MPPPLSRLRLLLWGEWGRGCEGVADVFRATCGRPRTPDPPPPPPPPPPLLLRPPAAEAAVGGGYLSGCPSHPL
ncbi:unnamed protein product, partial [Closterium sp. NIES-53]